jgi:catechol 2,3-dioxygenase-like lactoylglutathione lyase family enzyme
VIRRAARPATGSARGHLRWWLSALLLLAAALPAALAQDPAPIVTSLDSPGMTVSDMDRAIDFYSKVLAFEKISDVEVAGADYERLEGVFGLRMRVVRMRLGEESIELTEYLAPRGRPVPADVKSNDRSFQHIAIIVRDMGQAYRRLRESRIVHASSGPQTLPEWNKNAAGISAFYFRDPDAHYLEILQFPPDKGNPKWHRPTDRLFLGIDHTAIVVGDTDTSLKFYRDLLGLRVAGESENYGPEQEHLNNVFGARLRITSLKPPAGPSIELLEYLAPRDGRPAPDTRANDTLFWQTRLTTVNAEAATRHLFGAKAAFVSPGVVALPKGDLGFHEGLLVRDPDGHALQIVER